VAERRSNAAEQPDTLSISTPFLVLVPGVRVGTALSTIHTDGGTGGRLVNLEVEVLAVSSVGATDQRGPSEC